MKWMQLCIVSIQSFQAHILERDTLSFVSNFTKIIHRSQIEKIDDPGPGGGGALKFHKKYLSHTLEMDE